SHSVLRFDFVFSSKHLGNLKGRFAGAGELRKSESADGNFDVADGEVIEHTRREEIDCDTEQPDHDEVCPEFRKAGEDDDARDDFDDAGDVHKGRWRNWDDLCDEWAEIHLPVGKFVKELVEAGGNGADAESDTQGPPGDIKIILRCHVSPCDFFLHI